MKRPIFTELDEEQVDAILARHNVGRIAYSLGDRVDIEPIHYAFEGGWIFGRTSHGTKLTALAHRPWVAFEVDEVDAHLEWRSVVVRGSFYELHEHGSLTDRETYARAIDALRAVHPETLTDDDPVPFRSVLFGIHVAERRGRVSTAEEKGAKEHGE